MCENKWISVKLKVPEKDGKYLCVKDFKYIDVQSYAKNLSKIDEYDFYECERGGWYFYDSEYGYIETNRVTHWMPLPDLPEGD